MKFGMIFVLLLLGGCVTSPEDRLSEINAPLFSFIDLTVIVSNMETDMIGKDAPSSKPDLRNITEPTNKAKHYFENLNNTSRQIELLKKKYFLDR